jgi:choice-of-anchor A domain-containing protein
MLKIFVKSLAFVTLILLAVGPVHATNVNPFTDLGSAGPSNWQILSLGHCSSGTCDTATTNVSISASSQVDGNVGVAPSGSLSLSGSQIYGNAYVDTAGTVSKSNGSTITGTTTQSSAENTLLDSATTAAMSAYTAALNDTATITAPGTLGTSATTITGTSGINVISLTNLTLSGSSESLTLSAPTGGVFVIDISGSFSVLNGADITVAGGVSALNVMYNVTGTGSAVTFNGSSGSTDVQGIVLAPYRDITLSGSNVDGEIISGNLNISIQNTSTVDVPEPATLTFLAMGLAGLAVRIRRSGNIQRQ